MSADMPNPMSSRRELAVCTIVLLAGGVAGALFTGGFANTRHLPGRIGLGVLSAGPVLAGISIARCRGMGLQIAEIAHALTPFFWIPVLAIRCQQSGEAEVVTYAKYFYGLLLLTAPSVCGAMSLFFRYVFGKRQPISERVSAWVLLGTLVLFLIDLSLFGPPL